MRRALHPRKGPKRRQPKEKRAEARNHICSRTLDNLEVGVAHASSDGLLLYANSSFLNTIGARAPLNPGHSNLREFIDAGCWPAFETALQGALHAPIEGEMTVERADLVPRVLRLSFSRLRVAHKTAIGIVALEATELVRARQALENSEKLLQTLSGTILRFQDEERRRIARDLHDSVGQELAVLSIALARLDKQLKDSDSSARRTVLDSAELLGKIQEQVRDLSHLLHPPMLEELGLAWVLDWYVADFAKRTGIQVDLEMRPKPPRFSRDKEIAIFRLIQECLTNVLRHSASKQAHVGIARNADHLEVVVRDQGMGISPEVFESMTKGDIHVGVGISGMRERLKQLGGDFRIRSGQKGTEIWATVPMRGGERAPFEPGFADGTSAGPSGSESAEQPGSRPLRRRVLIADDHEVTRQGLKTLLATQPDIDVCGEVPDGLAAVREAKRLRPDLVILDSTMPRAGGFYAAHLIREAGIPCKILIFADYGSPQLERTAQAARCDGYVLKSNLSSDFLLAVRSVLADQTFFPPGVAASSLPALPVSSSGRRSAPHREHGSHWKTRRS